MAQGMAPDLWLLFAPVKKARTDFIAEKACEMGCRRLVPVFTAHTNAERVNTDRLRAHAVEAAEQCGLVSVPEVAEPVALTALLERWPADRQILFCDETGPRPPAVEVLRRADPGPWAVLTGPEGGFSPEETLMLYKNRLAHAVSLGPRILRADTAAVAALALWQSTLGGLAMSFIRPEAAAALRRYGEPAAWAAIAALGLWKGVALLASGAWIGLVPLALGAVAAFAVLGTAERALVARRSARAGPGIVAVQEGRISYLGPHGGASVAVDALVRIDIVAGEEVYGEEVYGDGASEDARWELTDDAGQRLTIPAGAANAGALLDVLGGLPGFNNMAVVLAMRADAPGRSAVWRRPGHAVADGRAR